ncbi:glycosyl transferase, group 1 family protein PslI, partial [Pseudomonas syringae pv. actinidiae ICMP 19079]
MPLLIERFQGEPADITQLRLPQRYW